MTKAKINLGEEGKGPEDMTLEELISINTPPPGKSVYDLQTEFYDEILKAVEDQCGANGRDLEVINFSAKRIKGSPNDRILVLAKDKEGKEYVVIAEILGEVLQNYKAVMKSEFI